MPIYQYQCEKCKRRFEVRQSFADKAVAFCPVCCGVAHRLLSPVPVLFKGAGFYITDSRKEKEEKSDAKGQRGKGKEADKGDGGP